MRKKKNINFLTIEFKMFQATTRLTILVKYGASLDEGDDPGILLKGTGHLLPGYELRHLLGQLPELLEVDVSVGQPGNHSRLFRQASPTPSPIPDDVVTFTSTRGRAYSAATAKFRWIKRVCKSDSSPLSLSLSVSCGVLRLRGEVEREEKGVFGKPRAHGA